MTIIGNIVRLLSLLAQIIYYSITLKIDKLMRYICDVTLKLFLRYRRGKVTEINSEEQEANDRAKAKIEFYEEHLGI
jgi:hypothetical protein|tara:strand:+ start:139 stop:369 length:231 start_codon:yes stop_codon:yes gene_type:complete